MLGHPTQEFAFNFGRIFLKVVECKLWKVGIRQRNIKLLLETVTYIATTETVTCVITIEIVMCIMHCRKLCGEKCGEKTNKVVH